MSYESGVCNCERWIANGCAAFMAGRLHVHGTCPAVNASLEMQKSKKRIELLFESYTFIA